MSGRLSALTQLLGRFLCRRWACFARRTAGLQAGSLCLQETRQSSTLAESTSLPAVAWGPATLTAKGTGGSPEAVAGGVLSTFSSLWALAESKALWWGQATFGS